MERSLILGATHALKDHLARQGSEAGSRRSRGPKEMLTEAERVLLRSAPGMSLFERLRRDATLREDIITLLKEFAEEADQIEQLQNVGRRFDYSDPSDWRTKRVDPTKDVGVGKGAMDTDEPMRNVPIQGAKLVEERTFSAK